jgi:hypothetical protein
MRKRKLILWDTFYIELHGLASWRRIARLTATPERF